MDTRLSVDLLKGIKSGTLEIKENNKESMQFIADKNIITINLIDLSFNIPVYTSILSKLSEAREFAKNLKENHLTLHIAHNGKVVMKLGKKAKPKLSRLITKSSAVEITDLRELRKLDKRLRQK
jgi:GTP1/Obg family GTP-binding protein